MRSLDPGHLAQALAALLAAGTLVSLGVACNGDDQPYGGTICGRPRPGAPRGASAPNSANPILVDVDQNKALTSVARWRRRHLRRVPDRRPLERLVDVRHQQDDAELPLRHQGQPQSGRHREHRGPDARAPPTRSALRPRSRSRPRRRPPPASTAFTSTAPLGAILTSAGFDRPACRTGRSSSSCKTGR